MSWTRLELRYTQASYTRRQVVAKMTEMIVLANWLLSSHRQRMDACRLFASVLYSNNRHGI